MLNITKITVGAFETNCYVISAPSLQALIVDPGAEAEIILRIVRERRLTVKAYLVTHGHLDHISALRALWAQIQAPVAMHGLDEQWAFGAANQMPPYYPTPRRPALVDRILKGGEIWDEDGFNYQAIATPGHSPGSVCFYFPDESTIFSGDTLFQDSVGRTDLPGGNAGQLNKSLRILAALPPQTKVCPGHGPETTIGRETNSNPFLKSI